MKNIIFFLCTLLSLPLYSSTHYVIIGQDGLNVQNTNNNDQDSGNTPPALPPYNYSRTTCEDPSLSQDVIDELNNAFGMSNSSSTWCSTTELYLGNRNLNTIPDAIGSLTNLQILTFDNNNISTLPNGLWNLSNLTGLYLNYNNISSVPDTIAHLTSLDTLYLQFNSITSVPDILGHMSISSALLLNNNQLNTVPDSLNLIDDAGTTLYLMNNPGAPFSNIYCLNTNNCVTDTPPE